MADDVSNTGKLPLIAHVLCGWPLVMFFIGGPIGVLLGVLAYGVNIAVYKSSIHALPKIAIIIAVGAVAWALQGALVHQ